MTSLHPMLSVGRQLTEHVEFHLGLSAARRGTGPSSCSRRCACPIPSACCRASRTSSPAGCASASPSPSRSPADRKLLIADEPTTALDVTVQAGILRLLDRLRRESDMAVLLISHDLGVMSALADTLHVMYAGRVVESGPVSELLSAPRHPYTRSLLDSLPDPTARGTELRVIRGEPPPPDRRPPGCPFAPRCAFVEPRASSAGPAAQPPPTAPRPASSTRSAAGGRAALAARTQRLGLVENIGVGA